MSVGGGWGRTGKTSRFFVRYGGQGTNQCNASSQSEVLRFPRVFFLIIFVTMHGWNYLIPSTETSVGGGQQKLAAAYQTYKQVITVDS